jgi:hypothetical protein
MEKKSKSEKFCPCGRIIADPNNKTGLCPKCQKTGTKIWASLSLAGIVYLVKKHGDKIIEVVLKNIIKS